jgi:hypothetical protein
MTAFASPGFGWGSDGSECLICFGFFVFILVCAATVLIHRASHYFAGVTKVAKSSVGDRKPSLEFLRAQLNKLSDEQRATLGSLSKSGRQSEAIQVAARFLAISVDDATCIVEQLYSGATCSKPPDARDT